MLYFQGIIYSLDEMDTFFNSFLEEFDKTCVRIFGNL